MASHDSRAAQSPRRAPTPPSVESFLETLEHPFKPEILALRQVILGADPSIAEGIKWNAPSFRTTEHFATFQLRAKDGVQLILHLGAKKRDDRADGITIADPEALLEWLGKDRVSATFRDLSDIDSRRSAFEDLIRQWIRYV